MHWLQAFEEARRRGAHAFLFTGAVGDGFPPEVLDHEVEPVDTLFSFGDTVSARAILSKDSALIWAFDPVRGFEFRDDVGDQKFRAFAGLIPPVPPSNNPVAQAAAATVRVMPLPTDRLAALRLMRTAMSAAARSEHPPRCVVILPHADVLAPAASAAAMQQEAVVALALLQMIADEEFRRAGHLIMCSAPTAASVHELLRRPDGPLTTIAIGKPTEEERRAFVERCCNGIGVTHTAEQRCAEAKATLRRLQDSERERIAEELPKTHVALEAHRARRDAVLERDRTYLAACNARDEAKKAFDRAFAQHDAEAARERRKRETETSSLDERLCAGTGALECTSMDANVWEALEPGDAVRVFGRDLQKDTPRATANVYHYDHFVLRRAVHGVVFLAGAQESKAPIGDPDGPIKFQWVSGAIVGDYKSGARPLPLFVSDARITRVRCERLQVEARFAELREALAASQASGVHEPRALRDARATLAEANGNIALARDAASVPWTREETRLTSRIATLESARANPQTAEIAAAAAELAEAEKKRHAEQKRGYLNIPAVGTDQFVILTQGLGYRDLATLLRDSQANETTVRERRTTLLKRAYSHLLEVVDPPYGFDGLAGLDHVKRVLSMARDAMLRGDRKAVPQGILLMGPPGTGKTAIAIAFARECGMLLVKMRSIRSMWIGESERRMEEVCQALLDLAPVVCFRDETDQEDSGRDSFQGDSGVSARMRQRIMEFEADERIRGRVLFVKATNRPDLMDVAMKRDGRADERIVVVTGDTEYAGLFSVYVRREGFPCEVTDFTPFTVMVRARGFSGAGVLNICRRAYQFGGGTITAESLRKAIEDSMPSADRVKDAEMTLAAIMAVSSRRNLPDGCERVIADAKAMLQGQAQPSRSAPAAPDLLDVLAVAGVDPSAPKN